MIFFLSAFAPDNSVSMYVWLSYIAKSIHQPDNVANPARGQLNREKEYFPVPVRA